MGRLKGLKDLLQDVVDKGATWVQEAHEGLAARPFDRLESVPPIAGSVKVVRAVHNAMLHAAYDSVRLVNRLAGSAADMLIERIESTERKDEAHPSPWGAGAVNDVSADPAPGVHAVNDVSADPAPDAHAAAETTRDLG